MEVQAYCSQLQIGIGLDIEPTKFKFNGFKI